MKQKLPAARYGSMLREICTLGMHPSVGTRKSGLAVPISTVSPTGGKFDGVIGIVCPLEVLRSAHAAGKVLPLELMIFAEEEGTTFGIGMIGSRLWTGDATAETINSFRNADCSDFFQAGESHGVRAGQLLADRFNASFYRGLVEIHIEQGPSMWERGSPIEIVATIAGRMQFVVELDGTPNHAGSTPMNYRRDALVAAANYILAVEKLAKELGDGTVATVGRIVCEPNAINVIPGFVRFTIDLRGPSTEVLKAGHEALKKINAQHVEGSNARLVITEDQPTVKLSDWVIGGLHRAALGELDITISGALHDAAIIAPLLPTAMLFVASKDGISHNPAEFSRIEDIAAAASVLEKLVADS